ncbi:MAG: helix-turn-helix domain-containing protein [Patescibacteria group bacterium]|jgi:excisionase family DNA binding protein
MKREKYVSTTEAGQILGLHRTQVFRLVKNGTIPAKRKGHGFLINIHDLGVPNEFLSHIEKEVVNRTVDRLFDQYGEALKRLGRE